jgi:tetratricopeptide (TPR) repeat protein
MNRFLQAGISMSAVVILGTVCARGQTQGSGGTPPAGGSNPSTASTTRTPRSTTQPMDQSRPPIFVTGRVLTELGRAVSEAVSIELNCGMRPVQVIHTDLGGYFTFNLGSGGQSNLDFSASSESIQTFGSQPANLGTRYGNPLAGCELRLSVAGYRPMNMTLTQSGDMGRIDVGNIHLERLGASKGTGISVTSLMVPKDASKEYERAVKDIQNNKVDSALPHLEKAVAIYDKYAAAWNELGRIYLSHNERQKASEAFEKAAAADSEYLPPLMNLATLQIQNREWEKGIETAGKVLQLDPDIGLARFLEAVGDYNLHHLDEAERNAKEAEKDIRLDNPQLHALLAKIYMDKQKYPQAADHMRTYLKQAPDGQFADQMKKDLSEIEEWIGRNGDKSASESGVPGS